MNRWPLPCLVLVMACARPGVPTPAVDTTSPPPSGPADVGLVPRVDPTSVGLDADAFDHLLWRAWDSRSASLVVVVDGQTVVSWPDAAEPMETMSMTKSVVSLAVGMLMEEGAIASLDAPVSTWFPQAPEATAGLTLGQLLSHTSGLASPASRELYAADDAVAFALQSEVTHEPGTRWRYNNNGSNLVAGIAAEAAGVPLDTYLDQRLWQPLLGGPRRWQRDDAGHSLGLAGLQLSGPDLAALGQLLLDGGELEGQTLVPPSWVARATEGSDASGGAFGLQWWTLRSADGPCLIDDSVWTAWTKAGVDQDFLDRIAPLRDTDLGDAFFARIEEALDGDIERWHATTWKADLPDCRRVQRVRGYRADGWLGQHLVVVPEARLVVVRQERSTPGHQRWGDEHSDTFSDLPQGVLALLPE